MSPTGQESSSPSLKCRVGVGADRLGAAFEGGFCRAGDSFRLGERGRGAGDSSSASEDRRRRHINEGGALSVWEDIHFYDHRPMDSDCDIEPRKSQLGKGRDAVLRK